MPKSDSYFRRGEEHPHHRLTDSAVCFIRRSGLGLNELAAKFGVDKKTVWAARTSQRWPLPQCLEADLRHDLPALLRYQSSSFVIEGFSPLSLIHESTAQR
jgi:hypothetical protein